MFLFKVIFFKLNKGCMLQVQSLKKTMPRYCGTNPLLLFKEFCRRLRACKFHSIYKFPLPVGGFTCCMQAINVLARCSLHTFSMILCEPFCKRENLKFIPMHVHEIRFFSAVSINPRNSKATNIAIKEKDAILCDLKPHIHAKTFYFLKIYKLFTIPRKFPIF